MILDEIHKTITIGNLFLHDYPKSYGYLSKKVEVFNQMSFFILLQKPDAGGRLVVYNQKWDDFKQHNNENNTLTSENLGTINLENNPEVQKEILNMEVGDFLIFQGGQLWHRVEGKTKRVSFGGFIGYGSQENDNNIYLWS